MTTSNVTGGGLLILVLIMSSRHHVITASRHHVTGGGLLILVPMREGVGRASAWPSDCVMPARAPPIAPRKDRCPCGCERTRAAAPRCRAAPRWSVPCASRRSQVSFRCYGKGLRRRAHTWRCAAIVAHATALPRVGCRSVGGLTCVGLHVQSSAPKDVLVVAPAWVGRIDCHVRVVMLITRHGPDPYHRGIECCGWMSLSLTPAI